MFVWFNALIIVKPTRTASRVFSIRTVAVVITLGRTTKIGNVLMDRVWVIIAQAKVTVMIFHCVVVLTHALTKVALDVSTIQTVIQVMSAARKRFL